MMLHDSGYSTLFPDYPYWPTPRAVPCSEFARAVFMTSASDVAATVYRNWDKADMGIELCVNRHPHSTRPSSGTGLSTLSTSLSASTYPKRVEIEGGVRVSVVLQQTDSPQTSYLCRRKTLRPAGGNTKCTRGENPALTGSGDSSSTWPYWCFWGLGCGEW